MRAYCSDQTCSAQTSSSSYHPTRVLNLVRLISSPVLTWTTSSPTSPLSALLFPFAVTDPPLPTLPTLVYDALPDPDPDPDATRVPLELTGVTGPGPGVGVLNVTDDNLLLAVAGVARVGAV